MLMLGGMVLQLYSKKVLTLHVKDMEIKSIGDSFSHLEFGSFGPDQRSKRFIVAFQFWSSSCSHLSLQHTKSCKQEVIGTDR